MSKIRVSEDNVANCDSNGITNTKCTQAFKLTEASVADFHVPPVDAEVVRTHERLTVRVRRQGVNVVRVCVRIYFLGAGVQRRGASLL